MMAFQGCEAIAAVAALFHLLCPFLATPNQQITACTGKTRRRIGSQRNAHTNL